MRIRIYFFVCFHLLSVYAHSQNDTLKYQTVLSYLDTNKASQNIIRAVFKDFIKKKQPIKFRISPWVKFMLISRFKDKIQPADYLLTETQVNDYNQYLRDYNFDTFISEFLKSKDKVTNNRLFLSFSKPLNNYLIVEICSRDPGTGWCDYATYMGILFRFDTIGHIETFITKQGVAN